MRNEYGATDRCLGSNATSAYRGKALSESIPVAGLWNGLPGAEAEERVAGKVYYLAVLDRLHRDLHPSHYLEIGIRLGRSLALARGKATAGEWVSRRQACVAGA
ncbi:hypothetical protein BPNPMPFG_002577 [Mesorhizobium sp. AR07]|uniref:hypothetical protein n=1 Tax=Mesorhizobium sp. AR07 TaxID=2865838 RepID=UPI00215F981B|nr:hypothetical protein [Mesorhizobium sp. AR07]UVK46862.1 hypothetical protein BPNPMPFG_002577 [Mesorhizobium sp. AR07]